MNLHRFKRFMLAIAIWYVWWLIFHAIAPVYAAPLEEKLTLFVTMESFLEAPWTLLTYPLIPTGSLISTLFSLLFLYFSGRMLFDLIGDRYLGLSLVAGVIIPAVFAVLFLSWWKVVMGFALAGITIYTTTILAAAITYMPKMPVHLFGIIRIPLYIIGLLHFASSIISYTQLGFMLTLLVAGATGYGLVRYLQGRLVLTPSLPKRTPTVVRKHPSSHRLDEDELNRILDKIRTDGITSLNADEKAFLDRFSS